MAQQAFENMNVTYVKGHVPLTNIHVDIYEKNSNQNDSDYYMYVPYVGENPVVSSFPDYTKIRTQPTLDSKSIPLTDGVIRFNGVDYVLQKLQTLPSWSTTFFARQKFVDSVLVGYDRVCIYSSTLVGTCFNKTIRFIKALFLVRRDEDGSIRYDSNGEYIIDRE